MTHGCVYVGDSSLSFSAVSTQTCSTCRLEQGDKDHKCPHNLLPEPNEESPVLGNGSKSISGDINCSEVTTRLRVNQQSGALVASNGPLQDVPDVML